jgi:hypothetical protein
LKRAKIEEENRSLLRLQHDFRRAADIVTDALMIFEEVEAVAVIGSVAKPLWKEVPRFSEFRNAGIEVWHECKDLDLAVWISSRTGSALCVAHEIWHCAKATGVEKDRVLQITKSRSS